MLAAHSIILAGGRSAIAVAAPADVSGEEAVAALALPRPHGAIVLNGGTTELPTDLAVTLRDTLGNGIARVAVEDRLTVVTGGTDAGIFSLFGQALGDERTAPCIGVVPAGRVIWPERASPADRGPEDEELVPLEPHHSHFLLVATDEWGAETEAMLSLADALSADCGSLAVLAGGGAGSRREILGACPRGPTRDRPGRHRSLRRRARGRDRGWFSVRPRDGGNRVGRPHHGRGQR